MRSGRLRQGAFFIRCLVSRYGGFVPAVRRRSLLSRSRCVSARKSLGDRFWLVERTIAKGLDRAVSTVSREVARHGGRSVYRANQADSEAWESALRPQAVPSFDPCKLRKIVASKLILDWSPEQISGWLKPSIPMTRACACPTKPFTVACSIQARGVLKKELLGHLRSKRRMRRSQHSRIL